MNYLHGDSFPTMKSWPHSASFASHFGSGRSSYGAHLGPHCLSIRYWSESLSISRFSRPDSARRSWVPSRTLYCLRPTVLFSFMCLFALTWIFFSDWPTLCPPQPQLTWDVPQAKVPGANHIPQVWIPASFSGTYQVPPAYVGPVLRGLPQRKWTLCLSQEWCFVLFISHPQCSAWCEEAAR